MSKYGMVINLHDCVSCGACALACKTENNTRYGQGAQKFNWADFYIKTEGTFPEVKHSAMPVLCNHCTDAPCVAACPVNPKAMYKTDDGITMHNDKRCIGCKACLHNCPYSNEDLNEAGAQFSIISFNEFGESTQPFYTNEETIIAGGTSSPSEVATQVGFLPPFVNNYSHTDYSAVRPDGVTEKCIFCAHRVSDGQDPYCVVSCPTHARIFGDMEDSQSEISQVLSENEVVSLKNNQGEIIGTAGAEHTPNVFYIGDIETPTSVKDISEYKTQELFIYPNPARDHIDIDLSKMENISLPASITMYDISGKQVKTIRGEDFVNKKTLRVNTASLERGTYIVSFLTKKKRHSATIVLK